MAREFPPPSADLAVRYVLPLSRDSARHGQVNVNGQPMAQGGGEEEVLSSHRLLQETGRLGNSASDGGILFQNGPFSIKQHDFPVRAILESHLSQDRLILKIPQL